MGIKQKWSSLNKGRITTAGRPVTGPSPCHRFYRCHHAVAAGPPIEKDSGHTLISWACAQCWAYSWTTPHSCWKCNDSIPIVITFPATLPPKACLPDVTREMDPDAGMSPWLFQDTRFQFPRSYHTFNMKFMIGYCSSTEWIQHNLH